MKFRNEICKGRDEGGDVAQSDVKQPVLRRSACVTVTVSATIFRVTKLSMHKHRLFDDVNLSLGNVGL